MKTAQRNKLAAYYSALIADMQAIVRDTVWEGETAKLRSTSISYSYI